MLKIGPHLSKKAALLSACSLASLSSIVHAQAAPVDSPTPIPAQAAQADTPLPTSGPAAAPANADVGDIIVTAQRRSERLVDVPMSITSITADQAAKAGVVNLHDIANVTAGVQINFAGCCTQPAVRGISTLTTGIGFENNVAIYVDGFYSPDNVTINSDLANIASIEVLKGPQGTLWGRNATGGAILINTLAPVDHFTGKVAATYGRYDDKSVGGYISGPIANGIRFSIAGYGRRSDGYNDLLDAAGNKIGHATPQRQTSIRTKLAIDVTSNLTATAAYNYGLSIDGRGNLFTIVDHASPALPASPPRPSTPFLVGTNRPTTLRGQTHEGTLKLALNTGIGTLSSYSGYAHRTTNLAYDFDGSYADLNASQQLWHQNTYQESVDYSITAINHLDLTIGGNYYRDRLHTPAQTGLGGGVVTSIFVTTLKAESIAGYIDGTYHLTDKLAVSAGGRYTHEKKSGYYQNYTPAGALNGLPGDNSAKFHAFTPRGSIRYELAPRTNVYASISRGFRTGGFQPNGAANPSLYLPFDPEHITAYELGLKAQRHRFSFSTAFFYYDYTNLQVGVTVPNPNGVVGSLVSKVTNAKRAEVYGIDGDLQWQPVDDLNVHFGAAWLHARYKDFHNATGTGLNPTTNLNVTNQAQDWTGYQMTRAPNFTANLGVDYTFRGIAGGSLQTGGNLHYTSSYITNNASLYGPLAGALAGQQRYRQGAYTLLNLQVTWTDASGHYQLGAFGNNVTNKTYRLTYSGGAFGDYSSFASPATWGVRVGYNF